MTSSVLEEIARGISGLNPEAWLVLPPGFVREEWKSFCFRDGRALTAPALQSPVQLAQFLVPEAQGRMLSRSARVELLREHLRTAPIREALPELLAHRFRPRFHEKLDRSLQKGRALFVHSDEAELFHERLTEKCGPFARRTEYFLFHRFWEALLSARDFFDEARLFEFATARLQAGASLPVRTVFWPSHFPLAPRIRFFRESLSRVARVRELPSTELFSGQEGAGSLPLERRRAHSLEDGARHLLDALMEGGVDREVVVMEDRPEVRRTLQRVSLARGLPLQDARDPTLLPQSEELKTALLELELAAKNFPRDALLSWVGLHAPDRGDFRKRLLESHRVQGIDSIGFDPALRERLEGVSRRYPRKMTIEGLSAAIGESVRDLSLPAWVFRAIESVLSEWREGLELLGQSGMQRPLRYWLQELSEQLRSAPPPVPPIRRERGVRVYRADQAPSLLLEPGIRVHFFGISASFFEPREDGTEWFTRRDLEVLGHEFSLPGRREKAESLRAAFRTWARQSAIPPVFWEHAYDESGSEAESAELALRALPGVEVGEAIPLPVHPEALPSLQSRRKAPSVEVRIPWTERELPLGFVNSLGNCAFTAYAQHLLRLFDERDPDFEPGGDVYGNLIHGAIEILVAEKGIDVASAFDRSWEKVPKPGWIRSDRLFSALREETIRLLQVFVDSDREYRQRSGTDPWVQEQEIQWSKEGFQFRGRIDRVDRHADGLVLIDYKTGSRQTGGQESLRTGKGLQLAAYALALQDRDREPVVSAQYVVLSPDRIQRGIGVLFQKWNQGKAADRVEFPLSFVRSNHTSLFPGEPEAVWNEFDRKIVSLIRLSRDRGFRAEPADPADCERCRYSGVCGRGRVVLA